MPVRIHHHLSHRGTSAIHFPWFKRLMTYASIWFIVCLADSMLSYFSPVYIESRVNNTLVMGLIMGSSSLIGLMSDIFLGEWFAGKSYTFFFKWALIVFIIFPLSYLLLPPVPLLFIIPMAIWGIAYELGLFTDFHFIHEALDHPHHSIGWSTLKTFYASAYLIGPLVAGVLLELSTMLVPLVALILMVIAILLYQVMRRSLVIHHPHPIRLKKHSLKHELSLWAILIPKLWPIILFVFVATMMDSVFWTVGAVFSQSLKISHPLGGFLLTAYVLPSLFAGFIGAGLSSKFGKKRTAFIGGILAGISYISIGFITGVIPLLAAIFTSAFFMAAAIPLIYASIEDYLERLGHTANALVSLESSTISVSHIIGPPLAGLIATAIGFQFTFSVFGALILLASLLSLILVPRKISLPQKAIATINTNTPYV
jgi:MFS family permease